MLDVMETPAHERRQIEDYLRSQSGGDFEIEHVEKLTSEYVLGYQYDVWDAHTSDGRWWVITNNWPAPGSGFHLTGNVIELASRGRGCVRSDVGGMMPVSNDWMLRPLNRTAGLHGVIELALSGSWQGK